MILHLLFNGEALPEGMVLPDHPFFTLSRWEFIGRCCSCYFPNFLSQSMIEKEEFSGDYCFTSVSSLKNYGGEIAAFFSWLRTTKADFFGYSRYEENPFDVTHYHTRYAEMTPFKEEG